MGENAGTAATAELRKNITGHLGRAKDGRRKYARPLIRAGRSWSATAKEGSDQSHCEEL
ncbi:hypothetical protein FRACA_1700007 [Frankia canadensis]|uniref:Uncharacterized protein n=1 Tax=Frankia canadensis TaxID=1836972 RepID=A0A2I2KN73_9ACTN|nr:hypothetical protein FRACA_1700007 [Frankia canadensis]SOU54405.1 hypothetical protein FRACA_1700007 [Frankia canadensis]